MKSEDGPPMTSGNAAAAHVRLIVWCLRFGEAHGFAGCRECRHKVEPATASLRAAEGGTSADPAEMADRAGESSIRDQALTVLRSSRKRQSVEQISLAECGGNFRAEPFWTVAGTSNWSDH
jgi:hypothetical protein